jgi:hypothetical protein
MELPNRNELESRFAARFARLNANLRHRLEDYLGHPPDITRVPESFWQEVQDEMNRELAIVLLLIWSQSAIQHGLSADLARVQGLDYATRRAVEVSPQFAANTRDMLAAAGRRWAGQPPTQGQLQGDLVAILGPTRAERAAVTETTRAQTAGGEAGARQTVGLSTEDLWITRIDLGGVCPICKPLHNQPRRVWERQFPTGPGDDVHPLCRCFIKYVAPRLEIRL